MSEISASGSDTAFASCDPHERSRKKLLGSRSAIALVIANTVGTWLLTTSRFALADLGEPWFVMLAWLVGGVYALASVVV